jgi:hypothetical protein
MSQSMIATHLDKKTRISCIPSCWQNVITNIKSTAKHYISNEPKKRNIKKKGKKK